MDDLVLQSILSKFKVALNNVSFSPINQGYINDTFLVLNDAKPEYILQRINTNVFKNPDVLHDNFYKALKKLKSDDYQDITLVPTIDNALFYKKETDCWRLLTFIDNSIAYNFTKDIEIAFEAGSLLGKFHSLLSSENPNDFEDIISDLNYLPSKLDDFESALSNTTLNRKSTAKHLIEFALANKDLFDDFYNANLPLRVCHNDTKLNNMLFDQTKKKGLCFIDLDTIMKGYFHYDFGDAIRTVVSESNEDEKNLEKIKFNTTLFESFIKGLVPFASIFSKQEIDFLPTSCALMPYMHGLRALTDYLNGNVYYKVSYENQNLDRCKSLFTFTRLAIINQEIITKIIEEQFKSSK